VAIKVGCALIPAIGLVSNYALCDQSRNYTGYEQCINILRTAQSGNVVIVQGDDILFPVIYGRIAERMREDVILYDRQNIAFKLPYLGERRGIYYGSWRDFRGLLERELIKHRILDGIYYAVFDPFSIDLPEEYFLVPYGLIYKLAKRENVQKPHRIPNLWKYYSVESFHDNYRKDFQNRQICGHFYFRRGHYIFLTGNKELGLKDMKKASQIAYDDYGLHSLIAFALIDEGLFSEARQELEKAITRQADPGAVNNIWGYYYYKMGDYQKAITLFRKATALRPGNSMYYKNLGLALWSAGDKKHAEKAFQKSLEIHKDQPETIKFMREHGLMP